MKRFTLALFYLCLLPFLFSEDFIAATANWLPYAIENEKGEISGIGADILKEVCKRTGDSVTIKIFPAERLNQMFDTNKIDINLADSPNWNEIKENSPFVFTESYSFVIENIYFLKNKYLDVKSPEDLKDKKVGIVRGYYYEMFKDAFNNKIVPFHEVNGEISLIQMLKENRVSCAFFDNYVFEYLIVKLHYKTSDFKKGMQLSNSPLGFKVRIEKKSAVQRFNKAINDMKKEGIINNIILQYTKK